MKNLSSFAFAALLLVTGLSHGAQPAGGGLPPFGEAGPPAIVDQNQPSVPGELIVRFKAEVTESGRDGVVKAHGDQTLKEFRRIQVREVKLGGKRSVAQAIREYQRDAQVLYAQPNNIYRAVELDPSDTYFSLLWAMKNTGQSIKGTSGVAGADIEAARAWNAIRGTTNVVVGVVDSGVDYTHPDLAGNVWSNPGGIGGGAAGTHGFNAVASTYDPMDDNGHGTHVSGTIGAMGNNGVGVVGVNWTTSIMGLKFLDSSGYGTTANAIAAIDFAVQAKLAGVNVRVLNASWGGTGPDPALRDELSQANANDILCVAAAGNGDTNGNPVNLDTNPLYPASFSTDPATPNLITVAATDNRDALAPWSNYGVKSVQLGAPGVNVASTWIGGQYYWASGTSMAAPHVTGSAALVLASRYLSVGDLKSALLNNVDRVASLAGKTVTGGRLNVYKALLPRPPRNLHVVSGPPQ